MGIFLVDKGDVYTYDRLLTDINNRNYYYPYYRTEDLYSYLLNFLVALVSGNSLTLLDSDISNSEVAKLVVESNVNLQKDIQKKDFKFIDEVIKGVNVSPSEISIFTSGTTGQPKKITHRLTNLLRSVRVAEKYSEQVWGFAYNPTHMAGLQVFFQAFMNKNCLVNVFNQSRKNIYQSIEQYKITHLSATPTFYRLLLPADHAYNSVVRVTFGGEKSSEKLYQSILTIFPLAKINNIYASTEAGSLFHAKGECFIIPAEMKNKIKVLDGELLIHKSLMGIAEGLVLEGDYYHTGDLIEWCDDACSLFRFVSRKNELINVGGYKVNPNEVKEALLNIEGIQDAVVYAKSNSVLGNILCADIKVDKSNELSEIQIREILNSKLQDFKIPRRIKFVDELQLTRTGKIQIK